MDSSRDGTISYDEYLLMRRQIQRWGIRRPEEQWSSLDFTQDGKVDFREWCDWAYKEQMALDSDIESDSA